MKCPNCKGEIEEGQNFCNHCGMPIPENVLEDSGKKGKRKKIKDSGNRPKKSGKNNKKTVLFPIGIGVLCLLIIFAVGLVVSPKQTTAGRLQEKLDLGNNYLAKAEYTKAKAAFKEALDIDEKSPEAALGMADAYNGEKNPKQAVKYLKKASENVKTASEKKDTKHVPQNASEFTKHYKKSCDTTAKQYANNPQKQQEVQKIVKEFNTITIYIPTGTDSSKDRKDEKKSSKQESNLHNMKGSDDSQPIDGSGDSSSVGNPDTPTPTENPDDSQPIDGSGDSSAVGTPDTPTPTENPDDSQPIDDPGDSSAVGTPDTPTPTENPDDSKPTDGSGDSSAVGTPDTPTPTEEPDETTPTPGETRIDVFDEITPTPTEDPDEITPTPGESRIDVFDEITPTPTEDPDKITPTPEETQIEVFDEITPTPTIEITPTPEDPGFEIKNEQSQTFENDNFGNQNSYNPSQENGSWEQSVDWNQDGSWEQSADWNQDESWEQNNEVNQNPESGENGECNESQAAPEEVLRNYAQTLIGQKAGFSGTSVPYTDSNSVNTALNGIVGIQEEDINKDGIPELLVVSMQYGRMSFTVYKVNNGAIEIGTAITAICDGTGTALGDVSYGCTQDCFIKDNADSYIVGFASYVYGVDAGDGTTAARTNFEAYKIGTDGNAELLTATTIQNGLFVYSGGDATNAQAGGQDMFAGAVGAAGFSGNWNAVNASTLDGMDLINNPYQDMCGAPDPLSGGLAAQEGGVQDLAIVNGTMGAGTGTLSFDLQDYTTFTN